MFSQAGLSHTLGVGVIVVAGALTACTAVGQTAQKGADVRRNRNKLRVDYVAFRPATWESEAVYEPQQDVPNRGGLVHIYMTNVSDAPLDLRYWRANGEDESHWLLGRFLAWHRLYDHRIEQSASTVLEINAVSEHFSEGKPFDFAYIDSSWRPAGFHKTILKHDPVRVSSMVLPENLKEILFHVRYTGEKNVKFVSAEVMDHSGGEIAWLDDTMRKPGATIGHLSLQEALTPGQLVILKLGLEEGGEERFVYAHRRAYVDRFPIGTWSANEETYALLRRLHVDTIVKRGNSRGPFFGELAAKCGFHAMVPTSKFRGADILRELGDHPAVDCWMLQDEPDWSTPPVVMLYAEETAKHYNRTKPTFITLCRNVKFFEYASIPDIPCMDHYTVTAPTSSKWPQRYGTRLEETAYYTRDLKEASEPKPIWVWSQAIASWSERPKRPVPTPEELAAQLMFNLGRGAKGILWFNYEHDVAERYPDVREAMKRWGRVMRVVRDDFLRSDPIAPDIDAPDNVDVAALVTPDKLILCITNQDYDIDPEAYPFRTQKDVTVEVGLPAWIEPAMALEVTPDGIRELPADIKRKKADISVGDVHVCALVVLPNDAGIEQTYSAEYTRAFEEEKKAF
ncbi:MAG: hypothetical protein R6V12_06260 [Candidatus Hydrogenedentota bacterium]